MFDGILKYHAAVATGSCNEPQIRRKEVGWRKELHDHVDYDTGILAAIRTLSTPQDSQTLYITNS